MIWTMEPTAKKLEDVETKVGDVGSTDLQSQVTTLTNKVGNVGSTDLQSQVTTLNSNLATKAKSAFLSWGTTFTAENFHHGLLILALNDAYIVWFASTSSIGIRSLRSSDGTKTQDGSISFGIDNVSGNNHTITRNGNTFSFTTIGATTATLLYV